MVSAELCATAGLLVVLEVALTTLIAPAAERLPADRCHGRPVAAGRGLRCGKASADPERVALAWLQVAHFGELQPHVAAGTGCAGLKAA